MLKEIEVSKSRIKRDELPFLSKDQQSWYLTRIRSYVETLAALWSYTDSVQTLRAILKRLSDDWAGTAFTERVTVKAIEKGWPVPQQQEDSHAQQNA